MDSYLFVKGHDVIHNDVKRISFEEELEEEIFNYPAFNTLGYVKNKVDKLQKCQYFGEKDGIYIKNLLSKFPIKVINLDRRPDRWEKVKNSFDLQGITNYERVSAVDGTQLEMTEEIKHIFRGNDFNYRQGVIGCALSHMNLWRRLTESDDEYYIIMEDDIEIVKDFKNKLNVVCHQMLQHPYIDFHFLGYFYHQGEPEKSDKYPDILKINFKNYMGGFYAYIISKHTALKFLHIAKYQGVRNAIDRFGHYQFNNTFVTHSEPHIVHSKYVTKENNIDSDIQRNMSSIKNKDE